MAKVICSEAIWRIFDRSMQILGGLGITDDTIVARLFREVRPFGSMMGRPKSTAGRSPAACCGPAKMVERRKAARAAARGACAGPHFGQPPAASARRLRLAPPLAAR